MTLGPAGTDAEAEALRLGADVELVESFPTAMRTARDHHEFALVAAGYLDPWSEEGSWVDLHFRYRLQMELLSVWQAPTKPICVAARPGQDDGTMDDFRSVAIHPSTRSLLPDRLRNLEVVEVRAKPHAVDLVCRHQVDVCLGSLDVANAAVARERGLVVVSNELHARVVLGAAPHTPMHAVYPERTLVLSGATKSHNLAAVGGGFVTAQDGPWLHAVRRDAGPEVAPARGIQQAALRAAYDGPDSQWLRDARARLRWSSEVLHDAIRRRFPEWRVHRPAATAFLWIEGSKSDDAAAELVRACGVRGLSGREFRGAERYVRLACARPRS